MKLTGFESNKINSDMVNHPSHYNLPNRKECIDEMIDMSFAVGFVSSFPTAHTNLYLRRVLPLLRLHPHYRHVAQW